MLDLIELERKLDESLQKETSETLRHWLINQSKKGDSHGISICSHIECKENKDKILKKQCFKYE